MIQIFKSSKNQLPKLIVIKFKKIQRMEPIFKNKIFKISKLVVIKKTNNYLALTKMVEPII